MEAWQDVGWGVEWWVDIPAVAVLAAAWDARILIFSPQHALTREPFAQQNYLPPPLPPQYPLPIGMRDAREEVVWREALLAAAWRQVEPA